MGTVFILDYCSLSLYYSLPDHQFNQLSCVDSLIRFQEYGIFVSEWQVINSCLSHPPWTMLVNLESTGLWKQWEPVGSESLQPSGQVFPALEASWIFFFFETFCVVPLVLWNTGMITKKGRGGTKPLFLDAGLESGRRLIFEQGNVMSHPLSASAQWGNNMGLGKEKRKVKAERTI